MSALDGLDTRFTQIQAMFAACGHNLTDALISGRLDVAALRRCVFRCHACRAKDRCTALLADGPALAAPPSYCANGPIVSQLRLSQRVDTTRTR